MSEADILHDDLITFYMTSVCMMCNDFIEGEEAFYQ
jgi:hypothetical protein